MTTVFACLVGEWICLNNDPNCKMGVYQTSPDIWWEENATIYAPANITKKEEHSLYHKDYIEILYKGKEYRINPIFIQIVTE